MSSITTDKGILHYEVIGRGKPVIFLHGWLGSWALWKEVMENVASKYRAYALDFWGFGESGRKLDDYTITDFVSLVQQFLDQMGIISSPLIGHSMGGTVSLLSGITYPQRISKIMVIGSPIQGSSLSIPLKLAGQKKIASLLYANIEIFRKFMKYYAPFICRNTGFPEMIDRDITNTTTDSFLRSIASLRKTDLRSQINKISKPVNGLYGKKDHIVNTNQQNVLKYGIPHAKIELFPSAGHFIMLDEPVACTNSIMNFLDMEQDE